MAVEKTKDYKKFKNFSFNRTINKSKLQSLTTSIAKENLLHLHPIIVDDQFNVIDGQHRLEAAKKLGVEIYYIRDTGVSQNHVMEANTNQSGWRLGDILRFYAITKKTPAYETFVSLMDTFGLQPKGLMGLIFGSRAAVLVNKMKNGSFELPEEAAETEKTLAFYTKFIEVITERRVTPFSMFRSYDFTYCVRLLCINKKFDPDVFFSKLQYRWFLLKPQATARAWFEVLAEIYNWKNSRKIKVEDDNFTAGTEKSSKQEM